MHGIELICAEGHRDWEQARYECPAENCEKIVSKSGFPKHHYYHKAKGEITGDKTFNVGAVCQYYRGGCNQIFTSAANWRRVHAQPGAKCLGKPRMIDGQTRLPKFARDTDDDDNDGDDHNKKRKKKKKKKQKNK